MKNRIRIFYLIFSILILMFLLQTCNKQEKWRGNVLIFTLDTTRADHIGSFGYERGVTPNIDKLAREGVIFKNCYSAVPLTLPSHCTIFTGKYPLGTGVRNNGRYSLGSSEETMAELFKKSGFNTYAVVSSFVLQSKFGLAQGFDIYDDSLDSHKVNTNFESQIDARKVYEKFSGWFDNNWKSNFFAWVHFYDPHTPYLPHGKIDKEKKDFKMLYDGEISYMDKYIGKIVEKLRGKKILENTLIVLVGDHGEAFGEHKEFASHMVFCYEANLKVPLIFFNKKLLKDSKIVNEKVGTIDIMQTILKLTGIKGWNKKDFDGISLTGLIKKEEDLDRTLYFESLYGQEELNWAPLTGIIKRNYKYISLPQPELYNLEKDPLERENLFRKKPLLAREMDKELKKNVISLSRKVKSAKRKMEKEDLKKLKALGYISSFSGKSNKNIDPKDGIVLNVKLKKISSSLDKENLEDLEKELLEIRKSKLGKDNFLVYDFLYRIYMKKRNLKKVMEVLKMAIKNLPNSIPFRVNYAMKLNEMGRYEEAISACRAILDIDPRFTRSYIILGDIYGFLGRTELSDLNYNKAIEAEPNNISLKIKFSENLIKRKEFRKALKIYNSLILQEEVLNNSLLLFKIAMFNTKYGSLRTSSNLFEKIEKLNPTGKYYFFHSLILAKIGKIPEALLKMKIAFNKYGDQLSDKEKSLASQQIEKWSVEM